MKNKKVQKKKNSDDESYHSSDEYSEYESDTSDFDKTWKN